jgi:hypothetical protein
MAAGLNSDQVWKLRQTRRGDLGSATFNIPWLRHCVHISLLESWRRTKFFCLVAVAYVVKLFCLGFSITCGRGSFRCCRMHIRLGRSFIFWRGSVLIQSELLIEPVRLFFFHCTFGWGYWFDGPSPTITTYFNLIVKIPNNKVKRVSPSVVIIFSDLTL